MVPREILIIVYESCCLCDFVNRRARNRSTSWNIIHAHTCRRIHLYVRKQIYVLIGLIKRPYGVFMVIRSHITYWPVPYTFCVKLLRGRITKNKIKYTTGSIKITKTEKNNNNNNNTVHYYWTRQTPPTSLRITVTAANNTRYHYCYCVHYRIVYFIIYTYMLTRVTCIDREYVLTTASKGLTPRRRPSSFVTKNDGFEEIKKK
jgi:hypothetical protein